MNELMAQNSIGLVSAGKDGSTWLLKWTLSSERVGDAHVDLAFENDQMVTDSKVLCAVEAQKQQVSSGPSNNARGRKEVMLVRKALVHRALVHRALVRRAPDRRVAQNAVRAVRRTLMDALLGRIPKNQLMNWKTIVDWWTSEGEPGLVPMRNALAGQADPPRPLLAWLLAWLVAWLLSSWLLSSWLLASWILATHNVRPRRRGLVPHRQGHWIASSSSVGSQSLRRLLGWRGLC